MNKRGKAFTRAEDDVIRLLWSRGTGATEIARTLGRGRTAIYKRIEAMKAAGTWGQVVPQLGQEVRGDGER